MEIRTYAALKAAGAARLVRKDDNAFEVQLRRFNPETGTPAEPQVVPLTKAGLEHAIGEHERVLAETPLEIAGIRGVLAEMEALNVDSAPQPPK